ncbi:MAG: hypothetical protein FJ027_23635, partial [Candidatus Rokubacteria bacterium]|nr:hypothetical protein [Candidatus Rokubacteria bacterium]
MIAFLGLNLAALLVAALAAGLAAPTERGVAAVFRVLCGTLVVIHTVTLAAGLTGRLTPATLAVLLVAAVVALGACAVRAGLWSWRAERGPLAAPGP